jgi:hypothetical protein
MIPWRSNLTWRRPWQYSISQSEWNSVHSLPATAAMAYSATDQCVVLHLLFPAGGGSNGPYSCPTVNAPPLVGCHPIQGRGVSSRPETPEISRSIWFGDFTILTGRTLLQKSEMWKTKIPHRWGYSVSFNEFLSEYSVYIPIMEYHTTQATRFNRNGRLVLISGYSKNPLNI